MTKSLGQIAYEAYAKAYPGRASELGVQWWRVPDNVKQAWQASALEVLKAK